jgi:hypothetical protein
MGFYWNNVKKTTGEQDLEEGLYAHCPWASSIMGKWCDFTQEKWDFMGFIYIYIYIQGRKPSRR